MKFLGGGLTAGHARKGGLGREKPTSLIITSVGKCHGNLMIAPTCREVGRQTENSFSNPRCFRCELLVLLLFFGPCQVLGVPLTPDFSAVGLAYFAQARCEVGESRPLSCPKKVPFGWLRGGKRPELGDVHPDAGSWKWEFPKMACFIWEGVQFRLQYVKFFGGCKQLKWRKSFQPTISWFISLMGVEGFILFSKKPFKCT